MNKRAYRSRYHRKKVAKSRLRLKYRHIGTGKGRIVYDLGNNLVLKVALSNWGIKCNKNEFEIYTNCSPDVRKYLCPVIECGDSWIIMKKMSRRLPKKKQLNKKIVQLIKILRTYGIQANDVRRKNLAISKGRVIIVIDYGNFVMNLNTPSISEETDLTAALDKAEEVRKNAEAEAKSKEEAERKAAEEKAKQEEAEEAKENQEAVTSQLLTEEKVKEILEYYSIGEADKLINFYVTEGEIKATIDLAPIDIFSAEDMAVTRYISLSNELLNHEGWEILTITYSNIGTISMNRNEKETNEYGDYFPTMEIEKRLK